MKIIPGFASEILWYLLFVEEITELAWVAINFAVVRTKFSWHSLNVTACNLCRGNKHLFIAKNNTSNNEICLHANHRAFIIEERQLQFLALMQK